MEPEGSLPHSQVPTTCPYPVPHQPSPYPPHPTTWRSILLLSSYLLLSLPSYLFPSGLPTKLHLSSLHTSHMSTYFTLLDLSPEKYLTKGTDHKAPHCAISLPTAGRTLLEVSCTSFLSVPDICLSTPFSNTLRACSSMSVTDNDSHP